MYGLMSLVLEYYNKCSEALSRGVSFKGIDHLKVTERIGRIKFVPEDRFPQELLQVREALDAELRELENSEVEE